MGRRKQYCPQRTGLGEGPMDADGNVPNAPGDNREENESDNGSIAAENNEANETEAKSSLPMDGGLASMLPLMMNPALMSSIGPAQLQQFYALQLAQLQAAQLLGPAAAGANAAAFMRKRKLPGEEEATAATLGDALNLSARRSPTPPPQVHRKEKRSSESPLDLSGSPVDVLTGKSPLKMAKMDPAAAAAGGFNPWANAFPFLNPFLASSAAAAAAAAEQPAVSRYPPTPPASSPSSISGGVSASSFLPKMSPSERNPLERMSEIAKTGCPPKPPTGGRHSAWQSQWISRGPENAKDIFKCVCCKSSFPSMGELTAHMRETGHYQPAAAGGAAMGARKSPDVSRHGMSNAAAPGERVVKRDILKDHLPIPRKLVRGQDVWLGKGEEQTKHILKCMHCGASFRSLGDLTQHMTETQHFKKVMSQDQLSSMKSPTSSASSSASPSPSPHHHAAMASSKAASMITNEQVNNSVLACKVCGQGFSTLKQLGDHVVKNNHFGDAIGAGAGGGPRLGGGGRQQEPDVMHVPKPSAAAGGGGRKAKSLPVKMLLELERANKTGGGNPAIAAAAAALGNPFFSEGALPASAQTGSIPCDKCGESFSLVTFLQHNLECSLRQRRHAAAPSPPGSSIAEPRRPESTKSTTSSVASNDDARSAKSSKSIIGSLEDMVNHNFGNKQAVSASASADGGHASDRSSVSPMRSSPATPIKAPPVASPLISSQRREDSPAPTNGKQGNGGNPLAALQSLCESTENKSGAPQSPKSNSGRGSAGPVSTPGSILAFSWACNQAVMDESVLKCHLCEAPFSTKGAYRHHLSKVHFINGASDPVPSPGSRAGQEATKAKAAKEEAEGGPGGAPGNGETPEEESQNKYHRYAELAKQLSSQAKPQLSTIA